jgi:ribosomal protein S16
MALLLDRRGDQITITEQVVIAAARNERHGEEVIALLLDRRGDQITITEQVVIAAARNEENGNEVMALLLDRRGDQITIAEEVIIAAAGNWGNGKRIMALLLDRHGNQIKITEKVVVAAAGNERDGLRLMTLLDQRARPFVSQEIIDAAAASGQIEVLHYFEKRFDLKISSSSFSITRLYNAAKRGDKSMVQSLLADGIPADIKSSREFTPLHQAAARGHERIVQLLLKTQTLDVNARDFKGRTALFLAGLQGHREIVTLLLSYGADPNIADKDGVTPVAFAQENAQWEIAELLKAEDSYSNLDGATDAKNRSSDHLPEKDQGNGETTVVLLRDQRGDQVATVERAIEAAAGNDCLTSDLEGESDCFYSAVAESDSDDTFYSMTF